jgi:hypothetical protein
VRTSKSRQCEHQQGDDSHVVHVGEEDEEDDEERQNLYLLRSDYATRCIRITVMSWSS